MVKLIFASAAAALVAATLTSAAPVSAEGTEATVQHEARDPFVSGSYGSYGVGGYGMGYGGLGMMGMGYGGYGMGYGGMGMAGTKMIKRDSEEPIDEDIDEEATSTVDEDEDLDKRDPQFFGGMGYGGFGMGNSMSTGMGNSFQQNFYRRDMGEDVEARDEEVSFEKRDPWYSPLAFANPYSFGFPYNNIGGFGMGYGGYPMDMGFGGYGMGMGMPGTKMMKRDFDGETFNESRDVDEESAFEKRDPQYLGLGMGYGGFGYPFGFPMMSGSNGGFRSGSGTTISKSFLKRDTDEESNMEKRDPLFQRIRYYPDGGSDYVNFGLFGSLSRSDY